ncbi:GspE/PulE family protein [Hahella ganghwensis]|uniref:GspE/PulE family protein n=1 Tax=Hahella ganghwensis TaxID=286420 RepID=UPI000365E9C5|nr:GspE/PulE family protein [Hahella ganghwensis]
MHLHNGFLIPGVLKTLDGVQQRIEISDQSDEHLTPIDFSEMRYLVFTHKLIPSDLIKEQSLAPESYLVEFNDGKRIRGKTLGFASSEAGLSLFRFEDKYSVSRLFIPATGIKNYQIEPSNGSDPQVSDSDVDLYTPQDTSLSPAMVQAREMRDELEKSKGMTDEQVHRALANKLAIPFIQLKQFAITPEAVALVPGDFARHNLVMPISLENEKLVVALDDPCNIDTIDALQFITNRHLELVTASKRDILQAIGEFYGESTIDDEILAAEDDRQNNDSVPHKDREVGELERLSREKPIIRLVSRVIVEGIRRRASDIHIRPRENIADLYYRIDGSLIKVRSFSKNLLPAVVSRIKILGTMDIAERRLPQDGRSRVVDGEAMVDLRISIIPTVEGESVVIRLLNLNAGLLSISELGFNPRDEELFTDLLNKSYGMILVTGPTGSGKSTTLYAALQEVIKQNVNIITVEDPVEYHIDGIEQIQVNTAPGYSFARALRHILRHDPDVIMIGEIRDEETGKIAVESALTGHLVLSTLHTNDAAGAITRLIEMGVEPFLLNATVLGVLAQRLVRRNCPHCMKEETPEPLFLKSLGISAEEVFYKGQGCDHCHQTGFSGRIAVYELLKITPDMHSLIQRGVAVNDIHAQAVREGMVPLTENALTLARRRTTSLSEVYRVRLE